MGLVALAPRPFMAADRVKALHAGIPENYTER